VEEQGVDLGMMSLKFEHQVAEIIRTADSEHFDSELSVHYVQGWLCSQIASALAFAFAADDPSFDRHKFMEACFPPNTGE
jgi:hypothetical protein